MTDGPRPTSLRSRLGHLEQLVPGLPKVAPRLVLAALPTPVTTLPALARELELADLLVKHDDATSPLFGGTKVRGLEFFFGRAFAEGRTAVLTTGSAGSNHAVATAVFGREAGLVARAVLFPHPDADHAEKNLQRLAALGAETRVKGWLGLLPALAGRRLTKAGGTRPLWIPPGGSSGLGVLGAAEGALEVVESARAGIIKLPEDVVVAAGSCGTAAGLALGFALARERVRIVAVRVVPWLAASRGRILRLASAGRAILEQAGFSQGASPGEVVLVQTQAGPGYGRPTAAADRAVVRVGEEGMRAETTYTGKAWAHLFSGALRGRRVMFWNTFGGRSVSGV